MNTPVVNIYGRRTIECLFDCISKLNYAKDNKIIIKAYAANIGRGIKIAHILKEEIGVEVQKTNMSTAQLHGVSTSFIEIPIRLLAKHKLANLVADPSVWVNEHFDKVDFINFSTYHLLLDELFEEHQGFEVLTRFESGLAPLLKVSKKEDRVFYELQHGLPPLDKNKPSRYRSTMRKANHNKTCFALHRCGALMVENWAKIAKRLSEKDDVILGIDTNILYNCTLTEHIIPMVSLLEKSAFVNTPNWILLVVPSTVMYEIENASNLQREGKLTAKGRKAFRALQEIMELGQNKDIPGVSLLITGETNPTLDMHNSLKRVSENIYELLRATSRNGSVGRKPLKSSSEDMIIRQQFRNFVSHINFHKNTYFLTSDKASSALALTEGQDSIYVNTPVIKIGEKFEGNGFTNGTLDLQFNPPVGSILYEMAVSYGSILVKFGDLVVPLSCDLKGDLIGRWLRKQLRIERTELEKLLRAYTGKFDLEKAYQLFQKMSTRFENMDWSTDLGGAFFIPNKSA